MTTTENTIMLLLGPTTDSVEQRLAAALNYTRTIISQLETALCEWQSVEREIHRLGTSLRTAPSH